MTELNWMALQIILSCQFIIATLIIKCISNRPFSTSGKGRIMWLKPLYFHCTVRCLLPQQRTIHFSIQCHVATLVHGAITLIIYITYFSLAAFHKKLRLSKYFRLVVPQKYGKCSSSNYSTAIYPQKQREIPKASSSNLLYFQSRGKYTPHPNRVLGGSMKIQFMHSV